MKIYPKKIGQHAAARASPSRPESLKRRRLASLTSVPSLLVNT